jgi:hypothetical protein
MKNPTSSPTPVPETPEGRVARQKYPAGNYLGCTACGRLLRIHWPTRSVVCSCGARVNPQPSGDK